MTQIEATYIDHMGSDLSVVNAARVSFKKTSSDLSDKDVKLIHYLAKHKHTSPFGHAFASFHIKAPVFVARQLVKHKFLRWNEVSRRYVDDEPEFYEPEVWRCRAEDKKQGSQGTHNMIMTVTETVDGQPFDVDLAAWKFQAEGDLINLYNFMIAEGVAPEQARIVLPQSMMTEWYWSGSLDAFADACRLRLKDDAQYETRLVMQQINDVMKGLFPNSWNALMTVV